MVRDLIVHAGAGKCGSSSLQSYLSERPLMRSKNDVTYEYVSLRPVGPLLRRETLSRQARRSVFGYSASTPLKPGGFQENASKSLDELVLLGDQDIVPILSNEGWINQAALFDDYRFFEEIGYGAQIVLYVRPPIDWLNSAYWQWGAWSDVSLDRWLKTQRHKANWVRYIKHWKSVAGVKGVSVRLATSDVVADFLSYLGCAKPNSTRRRNAGVSPDILRFFQRNRTFRQHPHASQVEFSLANILNFNCTTTPWIIPPDLVQEILAELAPDILEMESHLPKDIWEEIASDPRWWDPEAYARKSLFDPESDPELASADRLISELITTICDIEKRQRTGS